MDVRRREAVESNGFETYLFRRDILRYKVSFGLNRWLMADVKRFDALHIHALFSWSSTVAARAATKHRVPYVVRPLGVLNSWGLTNRRRLPKLLSLRLIELPLLRDAAAVHFTSAAEQHEALLVAPEIRATATIIPLPVEPEPPGDPQRLIQRYPELRDAKVVLFLSRVSPKKNLQLLLEAFAGICPDVRNAKLLVVGDGEESYVRLLHQRAEKLGIAEKIVWAGHLAGDDKASAFALASVFVLPSASENFGIAAAEALGAGVPAVLTKGVALSHAVKEHDAGWVVNASSSEIANAIIQVLREQTDAHRRRQNACRLVEQRYSLEAVGAALRELYEGIAAGSR